MELETENLILNDFGAIMEDNSGMSESDVTIMDVFLPFKTNISDVSQQGSLYDDETPDLHVYDSSANEESISEIDNLESSTDFECTECRFKCIDHRSLLDHIFDKACSKKCHNEDSAINSEYLEPRKNRIKKVKFQKYKCSQCNFTCAVKEGFFKHVIKHGRMEEIECEICCKVFKNARKLKMHMKIHTGEKPFNCSYCERKFIRKSGCKRHELMHTSDRPFECELCGFRFIGLKDLARHLKIHTEEKTIKCSECDYKCRRKNELKEHMVKHTGVKPYSCTICDRSFGYRSNLRLHMFRHAKVKPCKCPYCDFRCNTKQNLRYHISNHGEDGNSEKYHRKHKVKKAPRNSDVIKKGPEGHIVQQKECDEDSYWHTYYSQCNIEDDFYNILGPYIMKQRTEDELNKNIILKQQETDEVNLTNKWLNSNSESDIPVIESILAI